MKASNFKYRLSGMCFDVIIVMDALLCLTLAIAIDNDIIIDNEYCSANDSCSCGSDGGRKIWRLYVAWVSGKCRHNMISHYK
jgi:hypothetical protein